MSIAIYVRGFVGGEYFLELLIVVFSFDMLITPPCTVCGCCIMLSCQDAVSLHLSILQTQTA